jgi:hypothetical protein
MAKVALISKKFSPQLLSLAQALKSHHHDISIITSQSENIPDDIGFSVLTYFKKWTILEALRFFPRILGQTPEVWHFVFADTDLEKPSGAHWLLGQMAKALPGRVIVASFYDSLYSLPAQRIAPFVKVCDIVTTASRENLMYLKRKKWLSRFVETEVLPPFMPQGGNDTEEIDLELDQLTKAASPYLVIPSENMPTVDFSALKGQIQVLVCGSRPAKNVPEGFFFVGKNLNDIQLLQILKGSLGLLTAFDEFSVIELLRFHRLCLLTKTPTLANLRQTEALPGFCVHKRNGFVLDQGMSSLRNLFSGFNANLGRLELTQALFEPLSANLADSALNELNRLYSKVKNQKMSNIDLRRGPIS